MPIGVLDDYCLVSQEGCVRSSMLHKTFLILISALIFDRVLRCPLAAVSQLGMEEMSFL